ncbi:MAG: hypothetical protein V3V08_17480 [Nannocystaceae bacterium]
MTNLENQKYWLDASSGRVPIFSPSWSGLLEALENAPSFHCVLGAMTREVGSPDRPDGGSESGSPLLTQLNACEGTVVELRADKLATVAVSPGGWFSPAVFAQAFAQRQWAGGANARTWEQVFGKHGDLKFVCRSAVVASGLCVEICCHSDPNGGNSLAAQTIRRIVARWRSHASLEFETSTAEDHTLRVILRSSRNATPLLAVGVESVGHLMGQRK